MEDSNENIFKSISSNEFKKIIEEKIEDKKDDKDNKYILIDVRTPIEYEQGHIENSNLIDIYSDSFQEEINQLDKNKTYLIYCRSGARSMNALNIMRQMGFNKIYNLDRGIIGWIENNFKIV